MPKRSVVVAALVTVQILFGLNYVISKIVVQAFSPLVWASVRIIIASLVMVAAAFLSGTPHPKADLKFFGPLVIFALLGTVINQASFLVGLSYTTPTNSAILTTLIPVFTLVIVVLRGQESATWRRMVGFLSALAGVLVIRKIEDFKLSDKTLIGDLLTILNCLSYGFFLSYSKEFLERYDRFWTTTWLFIYGSVGLTLIAIPDYMSVHWPVMTFELWACAAFAIVGGTILTYFLNNWALAYAQSSHVALFIYIQPVIASATAWLWMGQPVTLRTVISTGLIFLGMILAMGHDQKQGTSSNDPLSNGNLGAA